MASTDVDDLPHEADAIDQSTSFGFVALCAGFVAAFLVATLAWFGALFWIVMKIWSWL